ncbi:hypothetical protein J3E68DRAFT_418897 [Trichoderma sp. SZMC 28012]
MIRWARRVLQDATVGEGTCIMYGLSVPSICACARVCVNSSRQVASIAGMALFRFTFLRRRRVILTPYYVQ